MHLTTFVSVLPSFKFGSSLDGILKISLAFNDYTFVVTVFEGYVLTYKRLTATKKNPLRGPETTGILRNFRAKNGAVKIWATNSYHIT